MNDRPTSLTHGILVGAGVVLGFTGIPGTALAERDCPPAIVKLSLDQMMDMTFDETRQDFIGDVRRVAWDAIHLEGGDYSAEIREGFAVLSKEYPALTEAEFRDWVHRRVWTTMVRDKLRGHRLPPLKMLKGLVQEVMEIQRKYGLME